MLLGWGNGEIGTWWKPGLLVGVVNVVTWLVLGGRWWKLLGLW